MKTKEILEALKGITMHEYSEPALLWAQQLAKDLRIAVRALKHVQQYESWESWEVIEGALREIDL
jgi:ribosomal protein L4